MDAPIGWISLIDSSSVTVTAKKKNRKQLTVLFFSLPPPSFLHSLSFTIYYDCVTGYRRVERGEQCAVTLRSALQRGAWLQLPCPSRPWGAWPPPRRPPPSLPPSLSTPTPSAPQSIACTPPYKRAAAAHASPCNRVVQGWKRGGYFWKIGIKNEMVQRRQILHKKSMCT